MRHHTLLCIVISALAASLIGHHARADLILFSDDFNSENGGQGALNYYGFEHWEVTRGSVDLHGEGTEFDYLPGNGLYVDLDGTTREAGRLETRQVFSLSAGTYQLWFDLAGSQRGDVNTVDVRIGEVFEETFTLQSNVPFTTTVRTFELTALASGRLIFDHRGGDNTGLLLNNVRLAQVQEPLVIPLPPAWAAGGALLLVLGGMPGCRRASRRMLRVR